MKENKLISGCSDRIRANITYPELLAQLAEECSELAQASLKYRRTMVKGNPTPCGAGLPAPGCSRRSRTCCWSSRSWASTWRRTTSPRSGSIRHPGG